MRRTRSETRVGCELVKIVGKLVTDKAVGRSSKEEAPAWQQERRSGVANTSIIAPLLRDFLWVKPDTD